MAESMQKKTGNQAPKRRTDAGEERDIERERDEALGTAGRAEDEDDLDGEEDEDDDFEEDDEA